MALMLNAVFSENTASAHVESFVNKPEKHALFECDPFTKQEAENEPQCTCTKAQNPSQARG